MALGLASKLMIFFIVINTLVSFAGGAGMIPSDESVVRASEWVTQLKDESTGALGTETGTSGLTILDYFNPLNYDIVVTLLSILGGFFLDPIFLFGTLPAPLGSMFGLIFAALEVFAIGSFIRGYAV